MEHKKAEVIILGGGLAGLSLAYFLQKHQRSFTILEARDRLGGRIHTIDTPDGGTAEMGATWFAEKHQSLMSLIHELDIPYEMQYTGHRVVYDFANPNRTVQLIDIDHPSEPSYIFSDGSRALLDALTRQIRCNHIYLGEKVVSIDFGPEVCIVQTDTSTYQSQFVVNTLPPTLFINTVKVTPTLPPEFIDLCRMTHTWMGESIKVAIQFPNAFWRAQGIGTFFSQFGPIQELHDHVHINQQVPLLKGFLHAHFRGWGHQKLQEAIQSQLENYFGSKVPDILALYYSDWQEADATYSPYARYVGPHQFNGHPMLRKSFYNQRLFFGGSESAISFPGYMDGAVERAALVTRQITM